MAAGRLHDLLKALWGGHTAALQIMLGKELQAGERKHAMRSRRRHEDDIMTACTAKSSPEMVLICLNVGLRRHVLHELAPFAAVQFMLGIQLQVGERKHAIRERRFARVRKHEDMHAIYLAGSVGNTYVCDAGFKNVSRIMT